MRHLVFALAVALMLVSPAAGADVGIQAYELPKGGGYPHDVAVGADGIVWYTAQRDGKLGRLDLDSGAATVIQPPTRDQGARRVWSDSKGRVWVSEWNSGNVSAFDPKANAWKTWRLPGEHPQTYAVYVDDRDKVWLTEWRAQAVVRFDPETEKFDVFASDRRSANVRQLDGRPGEVWAPESGADRLVVYRTK